MNHICCFLWKILALMRFPPPGSIDFASFDCELFSIWRHRNIIQAITLQVAIAISIWALPSAQSQELTLADHGHSDYKIVLADNASPSTKYAAGELQQFLQQITETKFPIVSDSQPQSDKEIIIGDNAHFRKLGIDVDFAALGNEGYVIRNVGNTLVIAGGALRGNMYGVYGLLQDHLGCRWFTPTVSRIPQRPELRLAPINDIQIPVLEYRDTCLVDCRDPDWRARNRINGMGWRVSGDSRHGDGVKFFGLAHTFNGLVPPEKFFDTHPEYYALVDGKRKKQQLCCTNPDVIRICTEGIRQRMHDHPDVTVFSVSQNDTKIYCKCPRCQEMAQQEGSQMAPVLHLVNQVAESVEKEFPGKVVQTLSYMWSRKPPRTMRPRSNVVIMLCALECCYSHPLATCDSKDNQAYRADIEGWSRITNRLWVWDYMTDFSHYLLPFPNEYILAQNIRFYAAHHVKGIYEQDTHQTRDSELAELGGYLTAKFLWNPNYDTELAINEFLETYYGDAAAPIHSYIKMLHDVVSKNNLHFCIYSGPRHPLFSEDLLIRANALWQQAENLVAGKPEILNRVLLSRMSVDYAIFERARLQSQNKLPANKEIMEIAGARFKPFCQTFRQSSITHLHEQREKSDKEEYLKKLAQELHIEL